MLLPPGYLYIPGTDASRQRDEHFQYEGSVGIADLGGIECECQCRGHFGGGVVLLPWVALNFPYCVYGHTQIFAW